MIRLSSCLTLRSRVPLAEMTEALVGMERVIVEEVEVVEGMESVMDDVTVEAEAEDVEVAVGVGD